MRKFALALLGGVMSTAAVADEGMWTFDAFPTTKMKSAYGWAPDKAWLDRVQNAAVRLTGGCSASFVSASGLILTNHHCVVGCLQNLATADNDLVANGFNALKREDERKCPGQQAEVVTSISDVTADIKGAIGTSTGIALAQARDGRIAELEKAGCTDTATTRCQVVSLFGGGQYKLYKYRKYSDVRIVWAPEFQAAFFGGDPDNFNFPRYALDGSFLRAYENGKPVTTPKHLTWTARAPQEGEATFVVGNPGSTRRLITDAQREAQRAVTLPTNLLLISEYRGRLITAMESDPEKQREGADELFGYENSYKALLGQFRALNDPVFAAGLAKNEAELRAKNAGNAAIGDPWATTAKAMSDYDKFRFEYLFMSARPGWSSKLYGYAQQLVTASEERGKPNNQRLPGYSDSALPLLEKQLLDPEPVYPWMEEINLDFWMTKTREYLTADGADTKLLLGKDSPQTLSHNLVAGSKLADPAVRKALWDGGAAAIAASNDPMIALARKLSARNRELFMRYRAEVDGPIAQAGAKLADARFAAYGADLYPDATFTLRISYGKVAGWDERGTPVPYFTKMGGAFDRATGQQPFLLAKAFSANQAKIDPNTTFDFTTTNDIIGGNSGSPVVDKAGNVIGAAFDGNIHSLGGNFGYDPVLNRTVVVSTAALQTAVDKLYPNAALAKELKTGS